MRTADYTEEMILSAGARLQEQGVEVNGWQLREALGGGNTKRLFAIWQRHNPVEKVVLSVALPESVKDSVKGLITGLEAQLLTMVGTLYGEMVDKANAKVVEAQKLIDKVQSTANDESERAGNEIDRLDALIEERDEQISTLQAKQVETSQSLQAALVELAHIKEKASSSEQALAEVRREAETLQAEVDRLTEVTSEQARALSASQQEATDLRSFLETRTTELNDARRSEQAAREREANASTQAATLERLRNEDQVLISRLRLDFSKSEKECGGLEARLEAALLQVESLNAALEQVSSDLDLFKTAVVELESQGVEVVLKPSAAASGGGVSGQSVKPGAKPAASKKPSKP